MTKALGVALMLLLAAAPVVAQTAAPPDSLLDRLIGQWVLQGTIAGSQTTHDVSFEWVLGRGYVQLHEVSRERTAAGAPEYEAIVYIARDQRSGQYACLWLDNTAAGAFEAEGIGHAVAAGDSLPFVFHISDTESFHTTFVYDRSADTWQWHMDDEQAGVWQPFARVTLERR